MNDYSRHWPRLRIQRTQPRVSSRINPLPALTGKHIRFSSFARSKSRLASIAFVLVIFMAMRALATSPAANPVPDSHNEKWEVMRADEARVFALGNAARAAQGLKPVDWDPALAAAALQHCERMADDGTISHRYSDEADIDVRAAQAGAHFSLVEENVAEGPSATLIHQAWMNSPRHRENLLSPDVNRVGVAVVSRGNILYAVVDFTLAVPVWSPEQVEAAISSLVKAQGLSVDSNSAAARVACAQDHGIPAVLDGARPEFIMRWKDTQLVRLPQPLLARIETGQYREAAIGSCDTNTAENAFTAYRVAVLLLKPISSGQRFPSTPK